MSGIFANRMDRTVWRAGWREIGGFKKYYRSRWEANYARYLEYRKTNGEIEQWSHEPKTFWFEGIKRGVNNYLPDFCVVYPGGSEEYHEVKGWMDSKSATKLKRMEKYHPEVRLILVDKPKYLALEKQYSVVINDWELLTRADNKNQKDAGPLLPLQDATTDDASVSTGKPKKKKTQKRPEIDPTLN